MGKTETTKKTTKTTAIKAATKVPERTTRAAERAAEKKRKKAAQVAAWKREVTEATWVAECKAATKSRAWKDLQAAERAMNALKVVYEEKETVWAKACIDRGELLMKKERNMDAIRQRMGEEWQFACFAKGYDEREEVFTSEGEIEDTNAWDEWKGVATRELWLTDRQEEKAREDKEELDRENAAEEFGTWDM